MKGRERRYILREKEEVLSKQLKHGRGENLLTAPTGRAYIRERRNLLIDRKTTTSSRTREECYLNNIKRGKRLRNKAVHGVCMRRSSATSGPRGWVDCEKTEEIWI